MMNQPYLKKGFVPGLKQPVMSINLELVMPYEVDLPQLDKALSDTLDLDVSVVNEMPQAESLNHELVYRFLLLSSWLNRYSGLPMFDFGKVLALTEARQDAANKMIIATCLVPEIHPSCNDQRMILFKVAMELLYKFATEEVISVLAGLDKLYEKIIKPLRRKNSLGDSTIPLLHYAYQNNIPFKPVVFPFFQLGRGKYSHLLTRSILDTDSAIGSSLSGNKEQTSQLLREAGMPTPKNYPVKNEQDLLSKAQRLGYPLVVKPIDLERSEGVTVEIESQTQLLEAYQYALSYSKNILVEEYVAGDVCRISIVGDELVFACKRLPKAVEGDGQHTVNELIDLANVGQNQKAPWLREIKSFPKDELALSCMAKQGYHLAAVPEKGAFVNLRRFGGAEEGERVEMCSETIHPENIKLAIAVSKLFRLTSVGVDLISKDISQPWYVNGAKVNELNFSPHVGNRRNPFSGELHGAYFKHLGLADEQFLINVFVGNDVAWRQAKTFFDTQGVDKSLAFVSDSAVLNAQQTPIYLTCETLHEKCHALMSQPEIEGLVVVVQTDEFYTTGIPFNQIEQVYEVNQALMNYQNPSQKADEDVVTLLTSSLKMLKMNFQG